MSISYTVLFLEKANKDIRDAYKYYETIELALAKKFEKDLDETLALIKNNPLHYRKVKNENRQLLMKIFSFVIVYRVITQQILITRVFHASRNPKHK